MAALKVGQRVRIVRAYHPENVGLETRIMRFGKFFGRHGHTLIAMSIELEARHPGGLQLCANPDQLEPILPEGSAPAEWSECLWQPEHLEELA